MSGNNATAMPIQTEEYLDKVRACWQGKNIGGTLGMPYEGVPGPLALTFYDPVPSQAVANDDLDLQLLWLVLAEEHGWDLNHDILGQAWLKYQKCTADEYGIARWNLRRGIAPPLSGVHNNWFGAGMGAVIRAEIWACLFPGRPQWAAHFAWLDASVDHAGEGVWAEVFLAACQSAAFASSDLIDAITVGLQLVPGESKFAQMINKLLSMRKADESSQEAITWINRHVISHSFTDCVMNMAFVFYGLLWGEDDFERSLLLAVNCGEDADCTGATCAATFGILHGSESIPSRWREPLGETIVASDYLKCLPVPVTLHELTSRTAALSSRLLEQIDEKTLPVMPGEPVDTIDDGNVWVICGKSDSEMGGHAEAPSDVRIDKRAQVVSFPGVCMDLSEYCHDENSVLFLQTYVSSPEQADGILMLCSQAGLAAWWDGKRVHQYYGRRPIVPAFHRVEGGGCVPINLEAGRSHLLQIRLIGCRAPLDLFVAIGNIDGDNLLGVTFTDK